MSDFKSAFQNGLEAAKKADASRAEIADVFKDLNQQITDASHGKLAIRRYEFERARSAFQQIALILTPADTYWVIGATNPTITGMQPEKLCNWDEDRAGYPCKLTWGGDEHYCEDKQALEINLSNLLSDPVVAKILLKIMNFETIKK